MRIAITGATGLLGRNLLFELIKQNGRDPDELEILILGRTKSGISLSERIRAILLHDGASYIREPDKKYLEGFFKNKISCIEIDLDDENLDLDKVDLSRMKRSPIDIFYHVAAMTDFRGLPQVVRALEVTNVGGTRRILALVSSLGVKEFCYVGTAYACGNKTGVISPNYCGADKGFRNPYEKTKLEAELMVREFSRKSGIRCRYFRPSTICGRLMESPAGAINKFDVFYSWAAFFLHHRFKETKDLGYNSPYHVNIRLYYNLGSGLNIVPADYAAKMMYHVCRYDDAGESYHLVNDAETPHDLYIKIMLDTINVRGACHVADVPKDQNPLEKLYYKTVGQIFNPYITSEPMLFDVSNLEKAAGRAGFCCPAVDAPNFRVLMNYAKKYDFGLKKIKDEIKN